MNAGEKVIFAFSVGTVGLAFLAYIFSKPNPEQQMRETYGEINPAMICPHCHSQGRVRTKQVQKKGGISGTKATAALFTMGTSLLVTGLAKKDNFTQAHCENCKNTWFF